MKNREALPSKPISFNHPQNLYPFLTAEANIIIAEKEKCIGYTSFLSHNDSLVISENQQEVIVKTGLKDYQMVEIVSRSEKG